MTIIAELKVLPIGLGTTELSTQIAKVIKEIKSSCDTYKIQWKLNSMSTLIEADNIQIIFDIVKKAHEVLFHEKIQRVVTSLTLDDRRDVSGPRMQQKVQSALNNLD